MNNSVQKSHNTHSISELKSKNSISLMNHYRMKKLRESLNIPLTVALNNKTVNTTKSIERGDLNILRNSSIVKKDGHTIDYFQEYLKQTDYDTKIVESNRETIRQNEDLETNSTQIHPHKKVLVIPLAGKRIRYA